MEGEKDPPLTPNCLLITSTGFLDLLVFGLSISARSTSFDAQLWRLLSHLMLRKYFNT